MISKATIFRISAGFALPSMGALEKALQQASFTPCGPTQAESAGWIAPRGNKSTVLAEPVGKGAILRLQVERRTVPASAIKEAVDAMVEKYKQETGRERAGAKLKKEFKEEAIQSLLPRAFPKRSSTTLWVDPVNHWLVVDGSSAGTDLAVSGLVGALLDVAGPNPTPEPIDLLAKPLNTVMAPGTAMAHWLTADAPHGFTVDRDCELKTQDDSKSAVRYSSHTLEIAEVAEHIAAGKVPVKLAMTWDGRVSFELSDAGQVRKIKLLDVVLDGTKEDGEGDDGFDTDAAIMTGELSKLIPDLIEALGGEVEPSAS
jgi:recombination associated protein RdgC